MNKELIIGDIIQELKGTRRILESLPDQDLHWRPHEKSMSLGELATHTVNLLRWQTDIFNTSELDLASIPARREALESSKALIEEFDESFSVLSALLSGIEEEQLSAIWTLKRGEQIMFQQPRLLVLRSFGINHMIHHRAQITVYLRLLDQPVPGLYGPSSDDIAAMAQ